MISKSYQHVQVGTREEESLETLSEDREWLCRCDVEQKVIPHVGAGTTVQKEVHWMINTE